MAISSSNQSENVSSLQTVVNSESGDTDQGSCLHPDPTLRSYPYAKGLCPTVDWQCGRSFLRMFAPEAKVWWLEGRTEDQSSGVSLPLVNVQSWDDLTGKAIKKPSLFSSWILPTNCWMKSGDLLVAPELKELPDSKQHFAFASAAENFCDQSSRIVRFPWIRKSENWQRLIREMEYRSCQVEESHLFDSGIIEILPDWDQYCSQLSKGHRKSIRKNLKNLEKEGEVNFVRKTSFLNRQNLQKELLHAFGISHRGWKGSEGTSVLSHPGMLEFFTDIAWTLAKSGRFELQLLQVGGRNIAFEIGYKSGGVYFSHKIGYDPEFKKFGPGQLLLYLQLEQWHQTQEIHQVDTMGILSKATEKWKPKRVPIYQITVANHGAAAMWVKMMRKFKPMVKKILGRS